MDGNDVKARPDASKMDDYCCMCAHQRVVEAEESVGKQITR